MKCLVVTGGCGFIGSNFIRDQLARYPEQSVVNIDKLTYAGNPENLADIEGDPRYRARKGDICDRNSIQALLTAAEARRGRQLRRRKPRRSQHSRFGTVHPNQRGRHAGAAGRLPAGEGLPVRAGLDRRGLWQPGAEGFFTEETPLAPNSPYSASKTAADVLVRAYCHTFGFPGRDHPLLEQLRAVPVPRKDHSPVHLEGPRRQAAARLWHGGECPRLDSRARSLPGNRRGFAPGHGLARSTTSAVTRRFAIST